MRLRFPTFEEVIDFILSAFILVADTCMDVCIDANV